MTIGPPHGDRRARRTSGRRADVRASSATTGAEKPKARLVGVAGRRGGFASPAVAGAASSGAITAKGSVSNACPGSARSPLRATARTRSASTASTRARRRIPSSAPSGPRSPRRRRAHRLRSRAWSCRSPVRRPAGRNGPGPRTRPTMRRPAHRAPAHAREKTAPSRIWFARRYHARPDGSRSVVVLSPHGARIFLDIGELQLVARCIGARDRAGSLRVAAAPGVEEGAQIPRLSRDQPARQGARDPRRRVHAVRVVRRSSSTWSAASPSRRCSAARPRRPGG